MRAIDFCGENFSILGTITSNNIWSEYYKSIRLVLRKIIGWVERGETQQNFGNVGLRNETQPTPVLAI